MGHSAVYLMTRSHLGLSPRIAGTVGVLGEGALGFGVSYGLGQLYHRKGETWAGKNAPRLMGGIGKGLAAIMQFATNGQAGILGGLVDTVGQAGVNAMGLELGLRHARKATGKQPVLLAPGAAIPAGAIPMTSIGELGQAAPGRGLSWDQINELASMR